MIVRHYTKCVKCGETSLFDERPFVVEPDRADEAQTEEGLCDACGDAMTDDEREQVYTTLDDFARADLDYFLKSGGPEELEEQLARTKRHE
jgi:hypothetical protein